MSSPRLTFNHIMQAAPWRKEKAEYYVDPVTGEQMWIATDPGISDPAWRNGQPTVASARPSSPFKRCKPNKAVTIERKTRKKMVKG